MQCQGRRGRGTLEIEGACGNEQIADLNTRISPSIPQPALVVDWGTIATLPVRMEKAKKKINQSVLQGRVGKVKIGEFPTTYALKDIEL